MAAKQPQGTICQSCSMPMEKPEHFGTNADGSKSQEYCGYCYQKGKFFEPNMTMKQMQDKVFGIMTGQFKMPEAQARQVTSFIPQLKRWKGR